MDKDFIDKIQKDNNMIVEKHNIDEASLKKVTGILTDDIAPMVGVIVSLYKKNKKLADEKAAKKAELEAQLKALDES